MASESSEFVDQDYDEFNESKTTKHRHTLSYIRRDRDRKYIFRLFRVESKTTDTIAFLCDVFSEHWLFARDGELIINADGINHRLTFEELSTNVGNGRLNCYESGVYSISKESLQNICDAESIKIRVVGASSFDEPDSEWCTDLQKYCQQFFNNVFDQSRYGNSLTKENPKPNIPMEAPKGSMSIILKVTLALAAIFVAMIIIGIATR